MTQQISPFVDAKWGWAFGESGWNPGMDENLLKFSFLFDRNIDGIVDSLPAAISGKAYYLTTDKRIYFSVNSSYYSTPIPQWFVIQLRSTGKTYQYNGNNLLELPSLSDITSIEATIATLGTAAFKDIPYFATKAQLDVESSNSAAYTDTLRSQISLTTAANIAELRTKGSPTGPALIRTYGYYSAGDGVGGSYVRVSTTAPSGWDNGGSQITCNGAGYNLIQTGSTDIRLFGAKCDGVTDDQPFVQACADAVGSWHFPSSGTCYLANKVTITKNNSIIIGLGCVVKQRDFTGLDARALQITATGVVVDGVTFDANGTAGSGNVTIFVTGAYVTVKNCKFSGNVGHYIFFYHTLGSIATGNIIDGEGTGLREITTAIVFETCFRFEATRNKFNNVSRGWGIQARQSSSNGLICENEHYQKQWNATITATQGQASFVFDMGGFVWLPVVQVKAVGGAYFLPLSKGYTKTRSTTNPNMWTIVFTVGRNAGELIRLAGYSGSENIQMNAAFDIVCDSNIVDGGGDSGIIALGNRISMTGNNVKNVGYAGIAIYGGVKDVSVNGGIIADNSQLDDGLSSPDDPNQPSAFCTGILIAGAHATVSGVSIINDSGTMKSGISAGNSADTLNFTSVANPSIKIGDCVFSGNYDFGQVHIPNDATGQRSTSIQVTDGTFVPYPSQINFDTNDWTVTPVNTAYWTYTASGTTSRDTTELVGGVASLKVTNAGYLDANVGAGALLQKSIVKVNFWAKRTSGSGYFSAITTLAGLEVESRVDLTDTTWKQYTLFIPISGNLASSLRLRMGSLLGVSNFQFINLEITRL